MEAVGLEMAGTEQDETSMEKGEVMLDIVTIETLVADAGIKSVADSLDISARHMRRILTGERALTCRVIDRARSVYGDAFCVERSFLDNEAARKKRQGESE